MSVRSILLLAIALLTVAVGASAQSAATADTTAAAPSDTLSAAAADSVREASDDAQGRTGGISNIGQMMQSGVADSLRAVAAADTTAPTRRTSTALPWYDSLRPTLTSTVRANVSEVRVSGRLNAPAFGAIGADGSITADAARTNYRQFDRDQEEQSIRGDLSKDLNESVKFRADFSRRSSFDENRPANIDPIVLELESADARALLEGDHPLFGGVSHHWALSTRIEDVEQVNRRVRNDRSLTSTGITSVWKREGDDIGVSARYGFNRSTGERLIRGVTDDATVEVDTLETKIDILTLPRSSITFEAGRSTFFEERLDFRRNANGVVDTTNVVDPVGREREVREGYDVAVGFSSRPFRRLNLDGDASRDFTETVYTLSDQGEVQRGSEGIDAGATFSYAAAGSVQVDFGYSDRFNDRRARGNEEFRGRESNKNYTAGLALRQKLFYESDLLFRASQRLQQNVFNEQGNNNDRDRLVDEAGAEIGTGAIKHTDLTVGGTVRKTQEINIASDRVGNNRDELLYEVRANYRFNPPGGFSASQTYRLQIVFRDFVEDDDRDTFNKQGQVTTRVDYSFLGGGRIGLEWLSDYRSTGSRDARESIRDIYITDSIRKDDRISANASLSVLGLNLTARAERGFLEQEQGTRLTEEERGKLSVKSSGKWQFLEGDRIVLDVDVERVLQFGPRVRDEQADYWVANTTLTVKF